MVACNDRPRRVNRGFTRFDAALAILQAVHVPLHRHVAPTRDSMRPLPAIVALMLAVASVCVPAQEGARLPAIGSSAGTVLSPADQRASGEMMPSQLRNYDYILEDPLVDSWLRGVGNRLAAARDDPKQDRSEEHTAELQSLMRISYAV